LRAILWGALRHVGMKDSWIWIAQALAFWLGHLGTLLHASFSFWLLILVGGLVFGWLAWRSHSIAPGMLAHGIANGLSQFIG